MLETLRYPLGALFLWIIARGFKLSPNLLPRALPATNEQIGGGQHQLNGMSVSQERAHARFQRFRPKLAATDWKANALAASVSSRRNEGSGGDETRSARRTKTPFILGLMRNGVCIKSLTSQKFPPSPFAAERAPQDLACY
jgi:hypothetical protein